MPMGMCHDALVKVREQLSGRIGSVFSSCGLWGLDSGYHPQWQATLPTVPSYQFRIWNLIVPKSFLIFVLNF